MQTADGLNGLFAEIRSKFGDTMGFQLTVHPDYANLDRADPQNKSAQKELPVQRRKLDQTLARPSTWDIFDKLVDLGKFDTAAVAAKMASAAQPLNVPKPGTTYLIVEGSDDGSTRIAIYVSGNGDSGYMNVNPDGSVKKIYPQD